MKRFLAHSLLWGVTAVPFMAQAAAPSNDTLTAAVNIDNLPFTQQQSTVEASNAAAEVFTACSGERYRGSVWYQYTASQDQWVLFDTLGSDYDTVLSIWTGEQHPLTEVTCNDDSGTVLQSLIPIEVTAETRYWIKVDSFEAQGGTLLLNAKPIQPLNNDTLNTATPISPDAQLNFSLEQLSMGAAAADASARASCGENGASVWYRYTPDTEQTVAFNTIGTNYDTVLSLWTGSPSDLTEVACNNDNGSDPTSQLRAELAAGTTYWLQVNDVDEAGGVLSLNMVPTPRNDTQETALELASSLPVQQQQLTYGAETEISTPSCGSTPAADVWFSYTAASTEMVQIDTRNSDYNTVLSVWTQGENGLTEIACNDDAPVLADFLLTSQLALTMQAEQIYYINVSGYEGETGGLQLRLQPAQQDFIISKQPAASTVLAGTTATLSVEVAPSDPAAGITNPVRYQWYAGQTGDTTQPVGADDFIFITPPLTNSAHYWVRIANPSGSADSMAATVTVQSNSVENPDLPPVNGAGLQTDFTAVTTRANFLGRLITVADRQPAQSVTEQTLVNIQFIVNVDPAHVGQAGTIVLIGGYESSTLSGIFALHDNEWREWAGTFEDLGQMQTVDQLPAVLELPFFEGMLKDLTGTFTFFIGYRLADGTLFYGTEPLIFSVR